MTLKLNEYCEPARIRAIVTAVLALCAALGIVLPFDLPGIAEALILIVAAVLPLAQGESTRAAVVPLQKHVDQLAKAAGHVDTRTPGYPGHAAPEA